MPDDGDSSLPSFAPNIESLSPPPNPPRRRRTANMSPVLCVPQRARPLFESLRGLCVGVPATSLPPHRPRRSSASTTCRRVPAPADRHGASCSRRPAPPPVRLRSCSLSSPHSPLLRFLPARCPSVGARVSNRCNLACIGQHTSFCLMVCSHSTLPWWCYRKILTP